MGGAVYLLHSNMNFSGISSFVNNIAILSFAISNSDSRSGGAIYGSGSMITFVGESKQLQFINNRTSDKGGAHYSTNVTFSRNTLVAGIYQKQRI